MRKPYRITEIARQIEYLMNMNCSVHIIVDKATVDVYRLYELSQDKVGFFRRFFGRERPRYLQEITEYNNAVLITFDRIDIPRNMIVFDYLLFAVGRQAAILRFTAYKAEGFQNRDRSITTYHYHVFPTAPEQNPDELNLELIKPPQGLRAAWENTVFDTVEYYTIEYDTEDIINLPDGWRAKVKCIRLFRPQFRKVKIRFVVEIP